MELKSAIKSVESADPSVTSIPVAGYLTPPQIATAYNIPPGNGASVKVGIISLGGGWTNSDFNSSMSNLGLSVTSANITTVPVNQSNTWTHTTNFSGNTQTSDGIASLENTLDLYCIGSMVPDANIVIYIGQNSVGANSGFANVLNQAVNDNCDVISISWGIDEYYGYGDFLAAPLANAVAKGISVFCSSGDYGSESDQSATGTISAGYPASSTNAIGVGGTILTLGTGNSKVSEITSNTSGGGISNVFSVPSWQNNLHYTTAPGNTTVTLTQGSLSNSPKLGRGVPDISAPMNSYALWFNGNVFGVGGTSAGTPVMAGMVARFISQNGGRRPPPGSLNPIFYNNTSSFFDLNTGNNISPPTNTGYFATSGWDAVTGLGSQANGIQTYQAVTTAGLRVKTASNTWSQVQNVSIKTAANTWTTVNRVWTKTASGWLQTY